MAPQRICTPAGSAVVRRRRSQYDEGQTLCASFGAGRVDKDGKTQPMQVKKGDRVIFGKYSGQEIKLEDIEHVILKEDEILGVIQ